LLLSCLARVGREGHIVSASGLDRSEILGTLPHGLRDPLVEEFNKILRNFRCGFRRIPITDSDSFRSLIPTDFDQ